MSRSQPGGIKIKFGRVLGEFRRVSESLGEFRRVWESFRRVWESFRRVWESLGEFRRV